MKVETIEEGFLQAYALLDDSIFLLNFNHNSPQDLKLYKLLQARQGNPDFEIELAEFICGELGNSFPYRSSYYLTKFFQSLGFQYTHDGSTRRFWVKDVLLKLSIKDISVVVEKGLFNKRDFKKEAKTNDQDYNDNYQNSIKEFKDFISDSLSIDEKIDLFYLLDFNINTELLFDKQVQTTDSELNSLITEAKERFYNPKDKQIAIEKLWDAFERIKTYYDENKKLSTQQLVSTISTNFDSQILENELVLLTKIGNEFRIRHHETNKKEITETKHLNYLFFRMLTLIDLCLTSIQEP